MGHICEEYLELPHLLELQPEFCHVPPHVKQARVDGRGSGRQGLAGRQRRLHSAQTLPCRNMGCSYEEKKSTQKSAEALECKQRLSYAAYLSTEGWKLINKNVTETTGHRVLRNEVSNPPVLESSLPWDCRAVFHSVMPCQGAKCLCCCQPLCIPPPSPLLPLPTQTPPFSFLSFFKHEGGLKS